MQDISNTFGTAEAIERGTVSKVWWRTVPLLGLVLLFNYLDKVNLGFAALTMNRDVGFSNTQFGAGAGCFAVGYALAAVPSTALLHRFGARRWMSLIMVAWGLCSAATAFVTSPLQLFGVRFLLGVAEAGFTPGCMLYFSYWFPSQYRGRVLASFLLVFPLVLLIGGPAASALLSVDGWLGLKGWQWIFIVESAPSIVLAFAVFRWLTDEPANARWLSAEQFGWLTGQLALESSVSATGRSAGRARHVFGSRPLWILAGVNVALSTSGIGAIFFLPLIVRSIGYSVLTAGWIVALPGLAAALALPLWGIWSDRSRHRERVVAAACVAIGTGLLATGIVLPSNWAIPSLCVAMVGFNGCLVAFWTLPYAFLTGADAAVGIAFINVAGNLGTFAGPYILGWLTDRTQSFSTGLICLAITGFVAAAMLFSGQFTRRD
jgi:ACS family tartrate transporter-like MFS transporter